MIAAKTPRRGAALRARIEALEDSEAVASVRKRKRTEKKCCAAICQAGDPDNDGLSDDARRRINGTPSIRKPDGETRPNPLTTLVKCSKREVEDGCKIWYHPLCDGRCKNNTRKLPKRWACKACGGTTSGRKPGKKPI